MACFLLYCLVRQAQRGCTEWSWHVFFCRPTALLGKYRWVILYGIGMFSFVLLFYAITKQGPWSVFESRGAEPKGGGAEETRNDKCMVIFAILYTCAENWSGGWNPPPPKHPGFTAPSKGVISLNCEHISMKQVIFCFVLVRVGTWVRVCECDCTLLLPKVRYWLSIMQSWVQRWKKQIDNNNMEMILVMIIEKENDYQLNYPDTQPRPKWNLNVFICVYC